MLIGIPKEIKDNETRVAISPSGAKELIASGNQVILERMAGDAIGFTDEMYEKAGVKIVFTKDEVYQAADMIVKVKEPQAIEVDMLKKDQILFSYLHLAAEKELTKRLLKRGVIAISYETVEDKGTLALLTPMSEVAGRVATQAGAYSLQKNVGGKGVLLGGVSGVEPAKVVIIGGGVVGANAATIASGMGAIVTILDKSLSKIRKLKNVFGNNVQVLYSSKDVLEKSIAEADLVIGAILVPGAKSPKVITKKMIKSMNKGSVIVDVSIDQGGCFETSKPTTHSNPIYVVNDVIHYCVTNMPAVAAKTASRALENATIPYILKLAKDGYKKALLSDKGFLKGLNIYYDKVTYKAVSDAFNMHYSEPTSIFS